MPPGQDGVAALKARRFPEAISLLSKALKESKSPTWLLARAEALQHTNQFELALADVEAAYHAAAERSSGNTRKQMIDAQYRRSVLLYRLGRLADADCVARWSQLLCEGRSPSEDDGQARKVDADGNYTVTEEELREEQEATAAKEPGPKEGMAMVSKLMASGQGSMKSEWNRAHMWRVNTIKNMEALPKDAPGRKVTIKKVPPKREIVVDLDANSQATDDGKGKEAAHTSSAKSTTTAVADDTKKADLPTGPVTDEKLKSRFDFYQTGQNITISMFIKGAKKDVTKVNFSENAITIGPLPRALAPQLAENDRQSWSTIKLAGTVDPASSRANITPNKIEFVLKSAAPGTKWSGWGTEVIGAEKIEGAPLTTQLPPVNAEQSLPINDAGDSGAEVPAPVVPAAELTTKPAGPPAYPTSAKGGAKNWDKLGADEKEDESEQDVNFFFKQIYKGATPEQQRAMIKSFTESNGTALSTDWGDVKDRTVETVPPEGVDAKKWE